MRRHLVELLEQRKEQMIAALWANSGFEGQEGASARRSSIEDLEEGYDEAIRKILSGEIDEDETPAEEDPFGFFEAGRRGVKKWDTSGIEDDASMKEVVEHEYQKREYAVDQQ